MKFRTGLYNIFILSLAFLSFLLCFTILQNLQKHFLESINLENPKFTANASLGTLVYYISSGISAIFISFLVNRIGPRPSMIVGGILLMFYNLQFHFPTNWLYYFSNVICGIGTSILWIAQGRFFTENSNKDTIARNAAIFSTIVSSRNIIGNMLMYFFYNTKVILTSQRTEILATMNFCSTLTVVFICYLLKAKYNRSVKVNILENFIQLFKLCLDDNIWLMIPPILYMNVLFSLSTVHDNALGFPVTFSLGKNMNKVSVCRMIFGVGGCVSGLILIAFDKKIIRSYLYPVFIAGCLVNFFGKILAMLNLPNASLSSVTWQESLVTTNYFGALIISFLFGIGDCCVFSRTYALFGILLRDNIAHAHVFMRIFVCIGSIITYFLVSKIGLYWILGITIIIGVLATFCYCVAELRYQQPIAGAPQWFPEENIGTVNIGAGTDSSTIPSSLTLRSTVESTTRVDNRADSVILSSTSTSVQNK